MRDADVRAALQALLRLEHDHEWAGTRVLNELSLCGEVRVDVAVLNGHLSGYELKSASDTLDRLPTQVSVYSRVLDEATLVVADRHWVAAQDMVPPWWGVIVAESAGTGLRLKRVHPPLPNPRIDPGSLVRLLWREELLDELTWRQLDIGMRSRTRAQLAATLTEAVVLDDLRALVRDRLKRREAWRAAHPRRRGGEGSRVAATPSDFRR